MQHLNHVAQLEAEISALEKKRGTREEPPALDAQIGILRRTRDWHAARLDQRPRNVGKSSLYEKGGRSQRKHGIRHNRFLETPLVHVPEAPTGA